MGSMLLAMVPLLVMAVFNYGWNVVALVASGMGSAFFAELIFSLIQKKTYEFDFSPLVTGLMIAFLLPANAPFWYPVLGAVFAIWVVKMPFGGVGKNIFNPAAAGFVFLAVCFEKKVFSYPGVNMVGHQLKEAVLAPSPAEILGKGGVPTPTILEVLLGRFPGPLGTTSIALMLCVATYVFFKRWRLLIIPAGFLSVAALFALFVHRLPSGMGPSLFFELTSGSLLFCALYVATDPVTASGSTLGRLMYGAGCGALTMLFRYTGRFEQGACIAILVMNAAAPYFDRIARRASMAVAARQNRTEKREKI